jgi:hypothetical protein
VPLPYVGLLILVAIAFAFYAVAKWVLDAREP